MLRWPRRWRWPAPSAHAADPGPFNIAEGNSGGARNFDAVTTSSTRRERTAAGASAADGAGIGQLLRAARTERGVSLADLQARTKIRAKFLAALEEERFEDLPPYPFARGFLQAYAQELGIDPEPLVARLASAMGPGAGSVPGDWRRLETAVVPAVRASRLRRALISLGVLAVVVGGALAIFFAKQLSDLSRPVPAVVPEAATPRTGASSAPAQPGLPTPTTAGAPAPREPGSTPTTAAAPATSPQPPSGQAQPEVVLEIRASGRSWVRVTAEGQILFEDFVTAGETRRWQSRGPVTIRLGNAGVVEAAVNGKAVGVLGQSGEVVERTFTKDDTR